ncbi:MAG: hypothetical protein IKW62_03040 [Clostridia bacterium]|nr:hypothetical protein [Clostridia bacterium]
MKRKLLLMLTVAMLTMTLVFNTFVFAADASGNITIGKISISENAENPDKYFDVTVPYTATGVERLTISVAAKDVSGTLSSSENAVVYIDEIENTAGSGTLAFKMNRSRVESAVAAATGNSSSLTGALLYFRLGGTGVASSVSATSVVAYEKINLSLSYKITNKAGTVKEKAEPGDVVAVTLNVSENTAFAGGTFEIIYDDDMLAYSSTVFDSSVTGLNPSSENGVVTCKFSSSSVIKATAVATLKFEVKQEAEAGSVGFKLTASKVEIIDGGDVVEVTDYTNSNSTTPLEVVIKAFTTVTTYTGGTNTSGNFTVTIKDWPSDIETSGTLYIGCYAANGKLLACGSKQVTKSTMESFSVTTEAPGDAAYFKVYIWGSNNKPLKTYVEKKNF